MHKLLARQLRKHLGTESPADPSLRALVAAVNAAYDDHDSDRALLERSIDLASSELREKNRRLQSDLHAIKRLEVELRQADKLRAVGQLASGIAHEINTPLQFASDSLHFLRETVAELMTLSLRARDICQIAETGADPRRELEQYQTECERLELDYLLEETPKAFDQAAEGMKRVAQIVMAMKDFGCTDTGNKTLVDVNRCLQNTLTISSSQLRYAAEVVLDLGELPLIPGHHGELGQVFLNLLVNAGHAIHDRFGSRNLGKISVSTSLATSAVVVRVTDNGVGIAEADRPRIFEPFFTTKELGRGTGQGLAISRSIITDKHGGSLWFETEVGVGTSFFVRLPLSPNLDDQASASAGPP